MSEEPEGLPELPSGSRDGINHGATAALANIEVLKAALSAAGKAHSEAIQAHHEALREVDVKHTPIVTAAKTKMLQAKRALDDAIAAQSSHPWQGKVVARTIEKRLGNGWSARRERVEERGVVEIIGPENPWGGRKYSSPEPGTPAVRLLTKSGKPGAKHELLNKWDYVTKLTSVDGWSLAE